VKRIAEQLRNRRSSSPVSLQKKSVSHQVPKPGDKKYYDEKIDISDLNKILVIDTKKRQCIAEPGVTFVDLVSATMKVGLVPLVVPELKTITIGGAVAGCSIESMSFKVGGFHDTCTEYEVITAKGEILTCSLTKNSLLFQMLHGTFGTLGIISKLTFTLIPAKKFVKVRYEKYGSLEEYKAAIWRVYKEKKYDFMDGIIHSPKELVLSLGTFVDEVPYSNKYDWMKIYYQSTRKRSVDYLRTPDYFFRYDKGVTNVSPKSWIGRLLFGKFVTSTTELWFAEKFQSIIPKKKIPITVDTFIPFSRLTEFFEWYNGEVHFYPLWCVPYKVVRQYEWIDEKYFKRNNDELFIDIAIYGMQRRDKNYYQLLEEYLTSIGAIKTLISTNYYSKQDFWKIWNKNNYNKVKKRTDPKNIFRNLHEKMCEPLRKK
ncbi:FAD-binding protein, partial [Candidatus Woesearchaeota archaeon]|nr:FAD-binding protein [Candidatus Woesearchaeota archaeon]